MIKLSLILIPGMFLMFNPKLYKNTSQTNKQVYNKKMAYNKNTNIKKEDIE